MRKFIYILLTVLVVTLLMIGCEKESPDEYNILQKAEEIAREEGYTIKPETYEEIMNGDSQVTSLIEDACEEGGFSLGDSLLGKEEIKTVGYELKEKSKLEDGNIYLCLLINKDGEVIGAYLDYSGYMPGIAPVDFKDNFKEIE